MAKSEEQFGYQGSETSRAEVTIYPFGDEIGILRRQQPNRQAKGNDPIKILGLRDAPQGPALVSVQMNKALGGAAGTFSVGIKARTRSDFDLLDSIFDDDWIDISFTRHDRRFHVMRGLIDDVRRTTSIVNGATSDVFQITGRDFTKVFLETQIYFNSLLETDLWGGAGVQILKRFEAFANSPINNVVKTALIGWLSQLGTIGRANWEVPPGLPGFSSPLGSNRNVLTEMHFFERAFSGQPDRGIFINGTEFSPRSSDIWSFAQEFSDPPMVELYCDLMCAEDGAVLVRPPVEGPEQPGSQDPFLDFFAPVDYLGTPSGEEIESDPTTTVMSVILRDRPFPSLVLDELNEREPIDGPWFTEIPLHVTPRQRVTSLSVGRSGRERLNAFFATPQHLQKYNQAMPLLQVPEWSSSDMRRHGMRRMDVTTKYVTAVTDLFTMSLNYRAILRDWHCMNHLFLNGTCVLGHGRPDIRVGGRFQMKGSVPQEDETYYVETVQHSWSYVQGLRTQLGLSRGFRGTDQEYVNTLRRVVQGYRDSQQAVGGPFFRELPLVEDAP